MDANDIAQWAIDGLDSGQNNAFYTGALLAVLGEMDLSGCAPAGSLEETDACEGAREALQRLQPASRARRLMHGQAREYRQDVKRGR